MRRGISVAGLLVAWLCAQGALTEGVQVYAWSRMFMGYLRTMTWRAAVAETFDPNKPCELCGVVRKVREAEQAAPVTLPERETSKFVLVTIVAADPELAPPWSPFMYVVAREFPAAWCAPVPKPPPRSTERLALL